MILPDWKIEDLCEGGGLVEPYDVERVNPASVDLCLGGEVYDLINNRHVAGDGVIRVLPGQVLLVTTVETVRLPAGLAGQLILKSSMGRRGLVMPAAGWVDPGFCGQLTIQLSAWVPVTLTAGQPFVQLVLHELSGVAEKVYAGRYQNQAGPTPARGEGVTGCGHKAPHVPADNNQLSPHLTVGVDG